MRRGTCLGSCWLVAALVLGGCARGVLFDPGEEPPVEDAEVLDTKAAADARDDLGPFDGPPAPDDAAPDDAAPDDAAAFDAAPDDAALDADPPDVEPPDTGTADTGTADTGFPDTGPMCVDPLVDCGGTCVNTTRDDAHCGACGMACAAGTACRASVCVTTCAAGETLCLPAPGRCVNTETDRANCGVCDNACAPGLVCRAGACRIDCPAPRAECADGGATRCVDLLADAAHCGRCGNACMAGQACLGGVCACPSGQALCGGACVDTTTNAAHCGACGNACPSGVPCAGGSCACSATCATALSGSGSGGGSGARCLRTYTFMAYAGRTYTISTCGSYTGDPYVVVSGACSCANDDACGLGAQCACTATRTGLATVCASTYSSASATWSYTVTSPGGGCCR